MTAAPSESAGGTERVTVSLPTQLARALRAAAEDENVSISGLVATSIHEQLLVRRMRAFLDDYEAEHGEITDEEIAEVRRRVAERSAPWQ
jgi:hypothetical protein